MSLSRYSVLFSLALVAVLPCVGCATYKTEATVEPGVMRSLVDTEMTESLFTSDQAVLGNEEIATILTARITLPEDPRMVILRLGDRSYWSPMAAALDRESTAHFMERLQACPRIREVAVLPSLLVPERKTVPYLREAAARYQAPLLLVYRPHTGRYNRYKTFGKDETKAYCTVEALLLDVRTGIVPFSTSAVEEYQAKESSDDFSFSETVDKAEQEATGRALLQIADQVSAFLQSVQ